MSDEDVVGEHRHRDEALTTGASRLHFNFGEKYLKALDWDLAVYQLLTMAPGVERMPTFGSKVSEFPLGLSLIT
jgi:hypothetical protein